MCKINDATIFFVVASGENGKINKAIFERIDAINCKLLFNVYNIISYKFTKSIYYYNKKIINSFFGAVTIVAQINTTLPKCHFSHFLSTTQHNLTHIYVYWVFFSRYGNQFLFFYLLNCFPSISSFLKLETPDGRPAAYYDAQ